jgi:ankyrin repeat protein
MNRMKGSLVILLCFIFQPGAFAQKTPATQDINQQLLEAAEKGDKVGVESLLAQGADPNAKDKKGKSALQLAARGGYADVVDVLLGAKADINLRANDGGTALTAAAGEGHPGVVERLLKAGADPNASDETGFTALMAAATGGDLQEVEALLAATFGYEPLVERLLAAGADPSAKASSCYAPGKTSLYSGSRTSRSGSLSRPSRVALPGSLPRGAATPPSWKR